MSDGSGLGLAPYAVTGTRGRRHDETMATTASAATGAATAPFELDRRRILHCTAFRRLVGKTQVFISHEGDHYRTRLTHTLEVAAHAERLATALRLNAPLAAAAALAHDLGHAPFGHAGEQALAGLMTPHGGFEHNVQSLRVVDYLEHPYPPFRGLNLSFELRESLIKHCTPFDRPPAGPAGVEAADLFSAGPLPPLEGQVANVADLVAYTLHDIEDGLMQGFLGEEPLMACGLWRRASEPVRQRWPDLSLASIRRPVLDAVADLLHADLRAASLAAVSAAGIGGSDDARRAAAAVVSFSPAMSEAIGELQALLVSSVYRHHRVVRMDLKAQRLIRELFTAYLGEPRLLPPRYAERVGEQPLERVVCDYIAGMTDRFCRAEVSRLFSPQDFDL